MADRQGSGRGEGKDLNLNHISRKKSNTLEGKRFVFRTFAQRIAAVNIDVLHSLEGDRADELAGGEGPSETPYAMLTLEKWVELNCTAQFGAFHAAVSPLLLSVPLMLRRREELFEILNVHLAGAPGMALKPILEVTAAVAADLRQEFYPEFPRLLLTLAGLLSPTDVREDPT